MYKKKEIAMIAGIVIVTLALSFGPTLKNKLKSNKTSSAVAPIKTEENSDYITISVKGEITVLETSAVKDSLELTIPYGYTYGYVITKITPYLNMYSIVDTTLYKTRYYEDTIITIESEDINRYIEDDLADGEKININTASKLELMGLYGIGDKRSDKIITYRKKTKIKDFNELRKVIGVSDEVIERVKEKAVCQ